MPRTYIDWYWEEAFFKHGFDDGDGPNFTSEVAEVLENAGYHVECDTCGSHNFMIDRIEKDGWEIRPSSEECSYGCENPRTYLPAYIVKLLDEQLPPPPDDQETI